MPTNLSLTPLLSTSFHEDFPHQLVAQQDAHWKPLLQWVRDTYMVDVKVYEGILNTKQTDATILKLGAIVGEYDQFKLAGSCALTGLVSKL
jgi:ATP synthase mitochondrial F1 complex assembly factor 2